MCDDPPIGVGPSVYRYRGRPGRAHRLLGFNRVTYSPIRWLQMMFAEAATLRAAPSPPAVRVGFSVVTWAALGILALGVLLRISYLDADPDYYAWAGYITDEGRWVQNARSLALRRTLFEEPWNMHFLLAPLFQLGTYVVFAVGGVSMLTSRLLTAVSGSAMLMLFWMLLRHTVKREALVLGVTLLAVQADLVMLSRMAVPEIASMLAQFASYALIVGERSSPGRVVLAGVVLATAVGFKATAALVLPIFSIMVLAAARLRPTVERPRSTCDLLLFLIGFGGPIGLVAFAGYWYGLRASGGLLARQLSVIWTFLEFGDAYTAMSFPFEDTFAQTANLWGLGLWISSLVWIAARDQLDWPTRRYLATSALWSGLFALLMLGTAYFPNRYKAHILPILALNIAVGASVLQDFGLRRLAKSLDVVTGPARVLSRLLLALPTAAFLAPWLASTAAAVVGLDTERLRAKLPCLLLAVAVVLWARSRWRGREGATEFLLVFPVVASAGWLALDAAGMLGLSFWARGAPATHLAVWSAFLTGAGVVAVIFAQPTWDAARSRARLVMALAVGYLFVSLVDIAPSYLDPHYSIRDASRDLGKLLRDSSFIIAVRSEGLFTENTLRYHHVSPENLRPDKSETVVIAFESCRPDLTRVLEREYQLVKNYTFYVSPALHALGCEPTLPSAHSAQAAVYRRR